MYKQILIFANRQPETAFLQLCVDEMAYYLASNTSIDYYREVHEHKNDPAYAMIHSQV